MRTDNAVNRTSLHELCEMFFPNGFTGSIANACIHNDPTIPIFERPKIDVIKPFHR